MEELTITIRRDTLLAYFRGIGRGIGNPDPASYAAECVKDLETTTLPTLVFDPCSGGSFHLLSPRPTEGR